MHHTKFLLNDLPFLCISSDGWKKVAKNRTLPRNMTNIVFPLFRIYCNHIYLRLISLLCRPMLQVYANSNMGLIYLEIYSHKCVETAKIRHHPTSMVIYRVSRNNWIFCLTTEYFQDTQCMLLAVLLPLLINSRPRQNKHPHLVVTTLLSLLKECIYTSNGHVVFYIQTDANCARLP